MYDNNRLIYENWYCFPTDLATSSILLRCQTYGVYVIIQFADIIPCNTCPVVFSSHITFTIRSKNLYESTQDCCTLFDYSTTECLLSIDGLLSPQSERVRLKTEKRTTERNMRRKENNGKRNKCLYTYYSM